MSVSFHINKLNPKSREILKTELTFQTKKTAFNPKPKTIECFSYCKETKTISVPLFFANKFGITLNDDDFPNANLKFTKTLYTAETDPQKRNRDQQIAAELLLEKLKQNRTAMAACHTGYGKTALAGYLAAKLNKKTVVMSYLDVVRDQLVEAFEGKVQKVTDDLDPDADVYVLGIQKIMNTDASKFKDIGVLMFDEVQMSTETALAEAIFKIKPLYFIGFSGTPDRKDDMGKLIHFHFGSPDNFVVREEKKPFLVIRRWTNFKPNIEYTQVSGKVIVKWGEVINSLNDNVEIWNDIVETILRFPEENIMVLCQRKVLANGIYEILKNKNESVDLFIGTKKKKDLDSGKRILICGEKKGGVGMDNPRLTMLILVTDTTDVRQFEGRIRIKNNKILDYRHNYSALDKHGDLRDQWYLKKGATLVDEGPRTPGEKYVAVRPRFLKQNK